MRRRPPNGRKSNPAWRWPCGLAAIILGATLTDAAAEPLPHLFNDGFYGFCDDAFDPSLRQYMIGYGNLMSEGSKLQTAPSSGPTIPVRVSGYQRAFAFRQGPDGGSSTLLAATPAAESQIVAGLFEMRDVAEFAVQDRREQLSCREPVRAENIEPLDGSKVPTGGEIWIYIPIVETIRTANEEFPMVQSYVDLFMTGCIELASKVINRRIDFVQQCIETTSQWSEHWVNDRIHARRAYDTVPHARRIDELIRETMPKIFTAIRYQ